MINPIRYSFLPIPIPYSLVKPLVTQGAQKGHSLLKKKSDALTLKFRATLKKIIENKTVMGDVMKTVYFSLAEAAYAAGDIS